MIQISNLSLPADAGSAQLHAAAAKLLRIPEGEIRSLQILRRSIDARKKTDVRQIYTVALAVEREATVLRVCRDKRVTPYKEKAPYQFPYSGLTAPLRPVVVGMGPAGLFAALCLARAGLPCILLERGQPVEQRMADVHRFWQGGALDPESNVQYGEGGAGTFSDGKLTTGINDQRIPFVSEQFVSFGAPADILWLAKPHIGTDKLRDVVRNMRQELLKLGCEIRFGHRLDDIEIENSRVTGLRVTHGDTSYSLPAAQVILAPGNSARDTFRMLEARGVTLSAKNFAVGVRIEHLQADINMAQYGEAATLGTLPASDYKLAAHLPSGRSVYTFCVCPGGKVVAAASQHGGLVTNGMSEYARDQVNCNGGLLVAVSPSDFDIPPLSGIAFQEEIEQAAFRDGGENYMAPAQLVGDFLQKRPSTGCGRVKPSYTPGVRYCNLWDVLPAFICQALADALPELEKKIRGFAHPEAVLTAVESRSSCPIRIDRADYRAVGLAGLYPCGEGAGYAGGIMSAAVDGIKCAEALCRDLAE